MKTQIAFVVLWIVVAAVAAHPAVAQTANDVPPPYPSTANAPALGQPAPTAQVPPPPASPSYGGQPYGGQPYGGEPYGGQPYGGQSYGGQPYPAAGSPSTAPPPPAPPAGPPAAEAPPGTYLNTYPDQSPYGGPYGAPPPPEGVVPAPGPVYVPAPPGAWVVPCWVFRLDLTFLQRTTTRSEPLFFDPTGQTVVLDSKTDLNFPVNTGFNFSALCRLPSGWELEFGYFAVDGWVAQNFVPGNSQVVVGSDGPGNQEIVASTDTNARYESALYLSEINLHRQVNKWLNLLIGFRAGELDETYSAYSDTMTFQSRTENSLYGFQVGADFKLLDTSPWHINALCKAGIYGNEIDQRSSLDVIATELEQHASQVAFLGELGLSASYDFGRHFSARAFFQAVWLSGVALAPEQVAGTSFNADTVAVNSDGSLFYYGGGLGLEFHF